MTPHRDIAIRDVTLRDGLQLTGGLLQAERKVDIVRTLLAAGVAAVEIGSLARPDLVPPMANTLDVVAALTPDELDHCWVWVATPGQARRAVAAGVRHLQYCLSVSEAHNRANIGRDVATSLDGMPAAAEAARDVGGTIQLCLATAFTCPFEGPVPEDAVVSIVTDPRAQSADIVVCDTLGQAAPGQVSSLVTRVRAECPERRTVFHGHDTWGQGVANSLAAVAAGADMVDGSLAGLGGCPFAPGAGGNTSTEDLLFALRPGWLAPAALHSLIALGEGIAESLGEPNCSRTRQGARSTTTAFPWAMA